ncbi:ferredoxin-fold anticodon-binding domain-containing protein 1-like [Plakobranchus ocellatus]|uniref:Ferredoxin-fold anticodon-binding domain-containing protein 1-like n=1 Tax=Plakobranchus ocellatus TaxID=259542 RepID=A0AAV3XZ88_9GAST|nr:ferredoxin-fold anticodon-binding domain-containing protein 1-like [Plakobranchus ocellatus]
MELACEGPVLLVGDGDFSFSLSLLKHSSLLPSQMTTSNLETPESIQQHKFAQDNMAELENLGVTVVLEVDAREMHNHPTISQNCYARIIFNFPLADRHNIKKNRALLADFFSSCSQVLASSGQVMITLCKGQGGTPADQPKRSWHDSWQIVAMAANAGFVLSNILPFDASQYPEYHSVGFRFQDKSFETGGSLIHVFEKADIVCVREDVVPRGTFQLAGEMFSCSQYIAEKLKRNLLKEDMNPVFAIRKELENALCQCFSTTVLEDDIAEIVIPGYKSRASVSFNAVKSQVISGDLAMEDVLTKMKRQKNEDNLTRKEESSNASFAHGVDGSDIAEDKVTDCVDSMSFYAGLVPDKEEAVYVLIKGSTLCENRVVQSTADSHNNHSVNEVSDSNDREATHQPEDCSNRVFHHRTSLLENINYACSVFSQTALTNLDTSTISSMTQDRQTQQTSRSNANFNNAQCVLLSGQCCIPCPVTPQIIPVHHELLFVHRISDSGNNSSSLDHSKSSHYDAAVSFESASSRLLLCLQNSSVFRESSQLFLTPICAENTLSIESVDEVSHVQFVHMRNEHGTHSLPPVGIMLTVVSRSQNFCILVLNLDSIACQVKNIPDPRLLWSCSDKVIHQFLSSSSSHTSDSSSLSASSSPSQIHFQPVSLFPMKFAHDLSFWENSASGEVFDEADLFEVIRYIAHDFVVKVTLMDKYTEPNTGRNSRCYRLHFQSHSMAFPYSVSWKLQSRIRIEVSHRLGVVLR